MNFFETFNDWISNNQALVISVGIPVFTLVITGWASYLSLRAKTSEVRLNGRMKLSEYRRTNFDELLRLSARLQSLFIEAASDLIVHKESPKGVDQKALLEMIECTNVFLLRSRASSHQIERFSKCVTVCGSKFFSGTHEVDATENLLGELREICKEIIDDEWARIENEFKGLS